MILVIDVGNTNIVLGVYDNDELVASWRMTTANNKTADETGVFIHSLFDFSEVDAESIDKIIISSVVPNIMYSLTHGIRKYFGIEPLLVDSKMKLGIELCMRNPRELGADRIVNLVAAYELYGGPAIVIDYGTATTFDVLDGDGRFITGITAPGIQICADALFSRTAQLPKIEIKKPASVKVKNTVGSIQAGIVFGHIGETMYMIDELKRQLKFSDMKVIATGGLARLIDDSEDVFDIYDPVLTLKGLRILCEKNWDIDGMPACGEK